MPKNKNGGKKEGEGREKGCLKRAKTCNTVYTTLFIYEAVLRLLHKRRTFY